MPIHAVKGAVEKPLEPGDVRVTSDHARSGVNAATDVGELAHSITSYEDVVRLLEKGCNLRVSDVEGAFSLLPLAPEVWPFFMFHWWDLESGDDVFSAEWKLYMHVCADFGAAGAPGTWNRFLLLGIARSENALKLPLAVHVLRWRPTLWVTSLHIGFC
eukprot:6211830-Pleurochrysis_carterae.AAC.1